MALKKKSIDVPFDDMTGEEIKSGGWALRGLNSHNGREYHFQGLVDLADALLNQPSIFGLVGDSYIRNELESRL